MTKVVRRGLHTYGYLLIIATIITVFAALTTIGVSAEVTFDTNYYNYNGEDGVTITGFNNLSEGETVTIPAEIEGKPVLAIGLEGQFWHIPGADKIGALDLSNTGVRVIRQSVFYGCKNLKEVIGNKTLEKMERLAFGDCSSLEKVILSDNITYIPDRCFYNCSSLKTVTTTSNSEKNGVYLPKVTYIDMYAFSGNYIVDEYTYKSPKIESVYLPGCKTINMYAFDGCENLADVNVSSLEMVEICAFASCYDLETIDLSMCKYIKSRAFCIARTLKP